MLIIKVSTLAKVLYEVSSLQRRRSPTFDKIASEALQAVPYP